MSRLLELTRLGRSFFPLLLATLASPPVAAADTCLDVGAWRQPDAPRAQQLDTREVMARLAQKRVILLGENHDQAEHHRWQLHMIAALHAHTPDMILGFEMFPRRVQQVLDDWSAGRLSEQQFIAASEWNDVWGLDPDLYMPLFDFARMNRIRMVALNVERELVRRTGSQGWAAIAQGQREGVGDPAPPSRAYLDMLFESFVMHRRLQQPATATSSSSAAPADPSAEDLRNPDFLRFVDSMQVWDRAMAEAIAARVHGSSALVVGIMGSGHLRNGFGVPHQLRSLGIEDIAVLLPWEANEDCEELLSGVADFVFGVQKLGEAPSGNKPRLGVTLDRGDRGVAIRQVVKGSVAEQAGAQAGDIIEAMAGLPVRETGDVVQVVQRQAPGTWLPMTVQRAGKSIELVARFPVAP